MHILAPGCVNIPVGEAEEQCPSTPHTGCATYNVISGLLLTRPPGQSSPPGWYLDCTLLEVFTCRGHEGRAGTELGLHPRLPTSRAQTLGPHFPCSVLLKQEAERREDGFSPVSQPFFTSICRALQCLLFKLDFLIIQDIDMI